MVSAAEDPAFRAALGALLEQIESENPKVANDATGVAGMLLEMNARPVFMPSPPSLYEEMVPEALRGRALREEEELEIVRGLEDAFRRTRNEMGDRLGQSASLLWAIGRASPWVSFRPLMDALHEADLSEGELYQALNSLVGALGLPPDHPHLSDLLAEMGARDPRSRLRRIAGGEWTDTRIARDARFGLRLADDFLKDIAGPGTSTA